jgi:hypothetical protein
MTYTVELATDVDELRAAYPVVATEAMRCAPPGTDLHPDQADAYHAVQAQTAYVARDEAGIIRGMAIIQPDGRVSWLTLPRVDSLVVMEALLDHFKNTTGVSPYGDIATDGFRDHVLVHPKNSRSGDGQRVTWRAD